MAVNDDAFSAWLLGGLNVLEALYPRLASGKRSLTRPLILLLTPLTTCPPSAPPSVCGIRPPEQLLQPGSQYLKNFECVWGTASPGGRLFISSRLQQKQEGSGAAATAYGIPSPRSLPLLEKRDVCSFLSNEPGE